VAYVWGYMRAQDAGYFPLKLTPINSLNSKLKTGDLIFTRAQRIVPRLQQYFLGSHINHVAMIYRAPDNELWVWDTAPSVGAYMCKLGSFIHDNFHGRAARPSDPPIGLRVPYIVPRSGSSPSPSPSPKSNLYIRRLVKPIDEKAVLHFLQKNLGRPYSYRFWRSAVEKGLGNVLRFPIDWSLNTDREGMFCSELLGHTLAAGGALNLGKECAQSLLPHDFWINAVPWTQDQTLTEPERLYGDPDMTALTPEPEYVSMLFENKYRLWLEGI